MLLTVTTTTPDATDLGYLLHKHPDRVHNFTITAGQGSVFYPEASRDRCTAALLLEVDPIALMRGRNRDGFTLGQYVNDRAYAASSLLSVALGKAFSTALSGRCNARPELVDRELELIIEVPCLPDPNGGELVRRLFAPLGWAVELTSIALDPQVAEWGPAPYGSLRLSASMRLAEALNQLYVLLPVIDGQKHYWVDESEVSKLLRAGGEWLATHPERELISRRYLANQRSLWSDALTRLNELDDQTASAEPRPTPLARQRQQAVLEVVRELRPASVVDLGCGEGKLLGELLAEHGIEQVVGTDVSSAALAKVERNLHMDTMTERTKDRLTLWQSSLVYRDQRLVGFDCAILMEVIEHIELDRLAVVERNVFGAMAPGSVIVTTPNVEYNTHYLGLAAGETRHRDHRFEWDRAAFASWAERVGAEFRYSVEFRAIGEVDDVVGAPTQAAVFRRVMSDDGGAS